METGVRVLAQSSCWTSHHDRLFLQPWKDTDGQLVAEIRNWDNNTSGKYRSAYQAVTDRPPERHPGSEETINPRVSLKANHQNIDRGFLLREERRW